MQSVGGVVCDPPYGLEFMGHAWDKLDWQTGGGFSKPGIGARQTAWPSFNAHTPFGSANPSCATCGGRLRGAKKCSCTEPAWRIKGEVATGATARQTMQAQQTWHVAWLSEVYRILVPGGTVKAFGGTRTFHRLAAAMEEVGFADVRLEAWGYGSGFPKSLDVSKALDRHAGVERVVSGQTGERSPMLTTPTSVDAHTWNGWGTALKPAWEPVVVGHKPVGCARTSGGTP